MRDARFSRELTIAKILRFVFVWSPEMNREDANSFRKETNTFHSCSHSSIGVVSKQLQRNDRTHRLLAATDNETVDELRKGRRPNVHLLLLRLSVDTVSDSLERQRYCLIQILRQRRPWHILCTVNQIGYFNTKLLTWKPLNVGY